MKKDIHPKYYANARATCACGNTFATGSTKPELRVEVCYKCHPVYTGEERLIDTKGQIDKFNRKQKWAKARLEEKRQKEEAKMLKEKERETRPRTLKALLEQG